MADFQRLPNNVELNLTVRRGEFLLAVRAHDIHQSTASYLSSFLHVLRIPSSFRFDGDFLVGSTS